MPIRPQIRRRDLKGFTAAIATLSEIKKRAPNGLKKGLKAAAEIVHELSQYYCPEETGRLKGLGPYEGTTGIRVRGGGAMVRAEIFYDTFYAVYVHEIPPGINEHEPPTRWKFLETAVRETVPEITNVVADHVGREIRLTTGAAVTGHSPLRQRRSVPREQGGSKRNPFDD